MAHGKQINGVMLEGKGRTSGDLYIKFELAPVLLDSRRFSIIDYSESMVSGVVIDTDNLINKLINHYMIVANQVNYGDWKNEGVETVQQLADYINKILTVPDQMEI